MSGTMEFVGMKSIAKQPSGRWTNDHCSDWVATEKVHGSSYQFFTNDGDKVMAASRRYILKDNGSFLKCGVAQFKQKYEHCVRGVYGHIVTDDRWEKYRNTSSNKDDSDDEEEEQEVTSSEQDQSLADKTDDGKDRLNPDIPEDGPESESNPSEAAGEFGAGLGGSAESEKSPVDVPTENEDIEQRRKKETTVELRIYGELYGGGGVEKPVKPAVQKEIIYSDEFRFYVFGITVNRNWLSVTEMNELCAQSGFPYYAIPMCEPKETLEELKAWLVESGYMKSRSRLTDRTDNMKTNIEGVVMHPLKRPGFGFHGVKFLSDAFNDVRNVGKQNKPQKQNYATKARYHSVISKLDLHEREDAEMVVEMFLADILKESGEERLSSNKTKSYTKAVRGWLARDGYITLDVPEASGKAGANKSRRTNGEEEQRERRHHRQEAEEEAVAGKSSETQNEADPLENDGGDDEGFCGGLFD